MIHLKGVSGQFATAVQRVCQVGAPAAQDLALVRGFKVACYDLTMETKWKTLVVRAEQTQNPNGSITIRPVEVADEREIGTAKAAKTLGVHRKTICFLCDFGEKNGGLSAWKLPSARGNARWRINLQSVLDYKERRINAARGY